MRNIAVPALRGEGQLSALSGVCHRGVSMPGPDLDEFVQRS